MNAVSEKVGSRMSQAVRAVNMVYLAVQAGPGQPVSTFGIPVYRELTGKSAFFGVVAAIFVLFNDVISMVWERFPCGQ